MDTDGHGCENVGAQGLGVSPFFFTFLAVNMSQRIQEMLKSWGRKLTTDGQD